MRSAYSRLQDPLLVLREFAASLAGALPAAGAVMPEGKGWLAGGSRNPVDGRRRAPLSRTQLRLVEAAKTTALRQLVAGVAHELNNPMSFIVGNVEPLRQHLAAVRRLAAASHVPELTALAERIVRGLELIARGAERATRIVADLRSYAAMGERHPYPLDVHESIELILRLLQARWADRIVIHRTYATVPLLRAAPTDVNQVLMHVLANACDAIPARGNIWIGTDSDGEMITVTVRDDGIGIPARDLERIFDPFFTTKPEGSGRGLGLAISQGIVASHDGAIGVTSDEGKGSEFSIVLPRRPRHERHGISDLDSAPTDA